MGAYGGSGNGAVQNSQLGQRNQRLPARKVSKGNDKYYNNRFKKRKVRRIMEKMFLRVSDVGEILGVSESYAYKLIRKLNKEMQDLGFQTIQGRIDTKFFYEHFYQTQNYERRDA